MGNKKGDAFQDGKGGARARALSPLTLAGNGWSIKETTKDRGVVGSHDNDDVGTTGA